MISNLNKKFQQFLNISYAHQTSIDIKIETNSFPGIVLSRRNKNRIIKTGSFMAAYCAPPFGNTVTSRGEIFDNNFIALKST